MMTGVINNVASTVTALAASLIANRASDRLFRFLARLKGLIGSGYIRTSDYRPFDSLTNSILLTEQPLTAGPLSVCPPRYRLLFVLLVSLLALHSSQATEKSDGAQREYFKSRYQSAEDQLKNKPSDPELAIQYAAAAFDWADYSQSSAERAAIAEPAIAQCRKHLKSLNFQAQAHYYLALNMGQLARTKWLGALRLVPQMEKHLTTASRLLPELDHGGPHRALSRLYFEAPRWPTSIGNRRKAKQQAELALKVAPRYPGNHLNSLEILLREGKASAIENQLQATKKAMTDSRAELNTPYWKSTWTEWEARLEEFQTELKKLKP